MEGNSTSPTADQQPPGKASPPQQQHIVEANNRIVKKIVDAEYIDSERLLQELQEAIKVEAKATCHYNLACIYQKTWKNQECCTQLERSIDFQELEIQKCANQIERMARQIELIRCFLQYCAVLSQLNRHDRALEVSKCIIRSEKNIFERCRKLCQERLEEHRNTGTTNSNLVRFEAVLIEEAFGKLQYLADIPDADTVLSSYQPTFQAISESIYYWKNIPENNEKLMRKELRLGKQSASVRNVLGVCKNDEWVDSFNIGSVMMMKPKLIEDRQRTDLLHLISAKSLLEQIFYTSIGYFTIATEIRFKEVQNDVKGLKQNEKLMRLSQNEFVKVCKVYHLKAIELAGRYVSTSSQYINHLILSFNKNYKASMDPIVQPNLYQNEESFNNNDSVMVAVETRQSIEGKPPAEHRPTIETKPATEGPRLSAFSQQPHGRYSETVDSGRKTVTEKVQQPPETKHKHDSRHEEGRTEHHTPNQGRMRSQTKESAERAGHHHSIHPTKRQNRIKSEQTYKKCQEIKTFTFKFVKEVKQSSLPKKKSSKKRQLSRKQHRK